MSIITISRQFGSFGDEIAQRVADKLNYEHVDKMRVGWCKNRLKRGIRNNFTSTESCFWHMVKKLGEIYSFWVKKWYD